MRQRHYRARVWLNEEEYSRFITDVKNTGLSKETYLRQLVTGYKPKIMPHSDYYKIIDALHLITETQRQIVMLVSTEDTILLNCHKRLIKTMEQLMINIQNQFENPF